MLTPHLMLLLICIAVSIASSAFSTTALFLIASISKEHKYLKITSTIVSSLAVCLIVVTSIIMIRNLSVSTPIIILLLAAAIISNSLLLWISRPQWNHYIVIPIVSIIFICVCLVSGIISFFV